MKKLITFLSAVATVAILSGCGGGGGILEDTPPSGTLDENFGGGDGYRVYETTNQDRLKDMDIDNNGNIYLLSNRKSGTKWYIMASKVDSSGDVVNSFGSNGIVLKQLYTNKNSNGNNIKVDGNKVYFTSSGENTSGDTAGALWCLNGSDGDKCNSFGVNGKKLFGAINGYTSVGAIEIKNNNLYIAKSYTNSSHHSQTRIYRLNKADGSFNSSYLMPQDYFVSDIVKEGSNIYSAGTSSSGGNYSASLWKFTSDLNFNFYKNKDISNIVNNGYHFTGVSSAVADSNGNIYITGFIRTNSTATPFDLYVAKFKSNGSLDTTFAINGIFTYNGSHNKNDAGEAIAIDSNGKIVVAGYTENGSDKDILLIRLNSDGSLDTSFNEDDNSGILVEDLEGDEDVRAMKIDNNGKIVIAGSLDNRDNFIAKINP